MTETNEVMLKRISNETEAYASQATESLMGFFAHMEWHIPREAREIVKCEIALAFAQGRCSGLGVRRA